MGGNFIDNDAMEPILIDQVPLPFLPFFLRQRFKPPVAEVLCIKNSGRVLSDMLPHGLMGTEQDGDFAGIAQPSQAESIREHLLVNLALAFINRAQPRRSTLL